MTAISILQDKDETNHSCYRAIAGNYQSTGHTPGEALDSLLGQEGATFESSPIVIQRFMPDHFFTQEQHERMKALMARLNGLTSAENEELDALIASEIDATIERAKTRLAQVAP